MTWGFRSCLGLALVFWLLTTSNPGQPWFPILLAAAALVAVGVWWCILCSASAHKGQRPLAMKIAPVIVLAIVALGFTNVPMKARWLVSEPAFNAIVHQAGPPSVQPPDPVDQEKGWSSLEPCPAIVGLYRIYDCEGFPGGYLFWHWPGSGLVDDAGLAYLPSGVPDNAGTGWFESPEFTHLHGDWYAFSSSW